MDVGQGRAGLLWGEVDNDKAVNASSSRIAAHLLHAIGQQGVVVTHEYNGHGDAGLHETIMSE